MSLLALDSVCVGFRRGVGRVSVLRGVCLEVGAGEVFAVYGRRGSGKTTLLEVAAGLLAPDSGRVSFGGRDLAGLSRRALARLHREEVGWVERGGPQSGDVEVGVWVGVSLLRGLRRREAHARAVAALERVGAGEFVGARWCDLPDTARVLVAIAQVLVREPRLLVVDDPVYGLGVSEREVVVGLLRELAEEAGVGVLLAVPEVPGVLRAHRVRVLAGGRLIGPPRERDAGDQATVLPFARHRRRA